MVGGGDRIVNNDMTVSSEEIVNGQKIMSSENTTKTMSVMAWFKASRTCSLLRKQLLCLAVEVPEFDTTSSSFSQVFTTHSERR